MENLSLEGKRALLKQYVASNSFRAFTVQDRKDWQGNPVPWSVGFNLNGQHYELSLDESEREALIADPDVPELLKQIFRGEKQG